MNTVTPMINRIDGIGPRHRRPLTNTLLPLTTDIRRNHTEDAPGADLIRIAYSNRGLPKPRLIGHESIVLLKRIANARFLEIPKLLIGRAPYVGATGERL